MTTEKIDSVSAALGLTLVATWLLALSQKPTRGRTAAVAVSTLAFVGYDRWHDGLWPFTDVERQRQADM